jgi:hypothetical protein
MAADQHEDDPEVLDETQKDREEAEQAKALNAVTDNVRQHPQPRVGSCNSMHMPINTQ